MIVRISAWIIVYDDKAISFKCSDGNVDNILNIFSKLVERNTGLDFDCPRKLVWNLLAPSAVIADNANFGTIFVHLTEIRCLGGTHGNQHECAGSGSGKCRRDEKLFRGLHRFPQISQLYNFGFSARSRRSLRWHSFGPAAQTRIQYPSGRSGSPRARSRQNAPSSGSRRSFASLAPAAIAAANAQVMKKLIVFIPSAPDKKRYPLVRAS